MQAALESISLLVAVGPSMLLRMLWQDLVDTALRKSQVAHSNHHSLHTCIVSRRGVSWGQSGGLADM